MEVDQIIKLMEAVSKHEITEISLEENGTVLTIKKENEAAQFLDIAAAPAAQAVTMQAAAAAPSAVSNAPVQVTAPQQDLENSLGNKVCSPLVGTFYAASAPGAEPFVKVGDTVKKGQVLGIIEAMKLMNEIESEYDGIVKSILVEDGNLIEYGQEMFIIE